MSAKNIFKETQDKPNMIQCLNPATRKTSIDPFACTNLPAFDSQSETVRPGDKPIEVGDSYKMPKIEHWETTPSKDGMAINVFLNIKFNLRNIMVRHFACGFGAHFHSETRVYF